MIMMTTTTNTAAAAKTAAKPTVRPLAGGAYSVSFPCGAIVTIYPTRDAYSHEGFTYTGVRADGSEATHSGWLFSTTEEALTHAWAAVVPALPALPMSVEEAHALARECERDVNLFTKTLKRLLRARTGLAFSVKCDRGTARSWANVRTSAKGSYKLTLAERVALSSVFGSDSVHHDGMSIRPCRNVRMWHVCMAIGVSMPEGEEVSAPSWD